MASTPLSEESVMQIREIYWPSGLEPGLKINIEGQVYELVHVGDPNVDEHPLLRWKAPCATCGEMFQTSTSRTVLRSINRRCQLHTDPRVPVRKFKTNL